MKNCSICKKEKALEEFHVRRASKDGLALVCKSCALIRFSKSYSENPEKFRRRSRNYRNKNLGQCRERLAIWRKNNPEKANAGNTRRTALWRILNPEKNRRQRTEYARKIRENPLQRLLECLRSRIHQALHGKSKSARTVELLGCSIEEFKKHIEKQFVPGMSWETRCFWEIDHIRPCAVFNLQDSEQQKLCFHYSNLRPLWRGVNRRKGAKV